MNPIRWATGLALAGAVSFSTAASAATTYYLGNSLTAGANPAAIDKLNAQAGQSGAYGYHIRYGSQLTAIYSSPDDPSVEPPAPYGKWTQALPNYNWDRIVFEPFYDPSSGEYGVPHRVSQFAQASQANGLNATSKYYIFSIWPERGSATNVDYAALWTGPAEGDYVADSRAQTAAIMTYLRADPALADRTFLVPAAEVVYALDQKMKAGQIPGFASANDLYSDGTHFNAAGCYLAALTMASVMDKTSPVGWTMPSEFANSNLTPAQQLVFQHTVWDVVTANSALTGVPEPASLTALGVAGLALARRRRT